MNTLLWNRICLDGVVGEACHILALKATEVEVSSRGLPLLPLLVRWTVSSWASLARGISSTFQQLLFVDDDRVSLTVHVTEFNLLVTRGEVSILARQSRIIKTSLKQLSALFLRWESISGFLAKAGRSLHGHLWQQVVFAHDWVHWLVGASRTQLRWVPVLRRCLLITGRSCEQIPILTAHHQLFCIKSVFDATPGALA